MLTLCNAAAIRMLTELVDTGNELDALIMALYKNDVIPAVTDVFADYTAADFDGAAPSSAIAWGDVFLNADGKATVVGDTKQFTSTGDTTPNTVYGYFVYKSPSTLVFAERFETPVNIDDTGQAVVVVPQFQLSDAGG